jgi:hypothetical protein
VSILADVAIAPFIFLGGIVFVPVLLALVVLVEGIVAWRMKWADFRLSLRDVFIANLVSTLVGVALETLFSVSVYQCPYLPVDQGRHVARICSWVISPLILYPLLCLISVAIEGAILLRFKRAAPRRTWIVAVVANVVSYLILFPAYAIFLAVF